MNERTEDLLAQMEQATSAQSAEPLDDESAMLRENWLAFGQLLDAVDRESRPPIVNLAPTRRTTLSAGLIAAVAASLLAALAAWTILNRESKNLLPPAEIAAPSLLPDKTSATPDLADAPATTELDEVLDEFTWDDSFDEQLALTSQAIRTAQADWNGGDRRYSLLLDQLEQFSEELNEGSL